MRSSTHTGRSAPSTPPGQRIYAIGDVHGHAALLAELTDLIEADARASGQDALIVLLGDYVDRGPQSADVLRRVLSKAFPLPVEALRGNHEGMLLSFLDDPGVLDHWRHNGGLQTLQSFGIEVDAAGSFADFEAAQRRLHDRLGRAAIEALRRLPLRVRHGDYFFCHAGVRPGVALDAQDPEDLVWIRRDFLDSDADFGAVVVHGHTPTKTPEIRPNRINVDTGAFATGILTAVVLDGSRRSFLSTGGFQAGS